MTRHDEVAVNFQYMLNLLDLKAPSPLMKPPTRQRRRVRKKPTVVLVEEPESDGFKPIFIPTSIARELAEKRQRETEREERRLEYLSTRNGGGDLREPVVGARLTKYNVITPRRTDAAVYEKLTAPYRSDQELFRALLERMEKMTSKAKKSKKKGKEKENKSSTPLPQIPVSLVERLNLAAIRRENTITTEESSRSNDSSRWHEKIKQIEDVRTRDQQSFTERRVCLWLTIYVIQKGLLVTNRIVQGVRAKKFDDLYKWNTVLKIQRFYRKCMFRMKFDPHRLQEKESREKSYFDSDPLEEGASYAARRDNRTKNEMLRRMAKARPKYHFRLNSAALITTFLLDCREQAVYKIKIRKFVGHARKLQQMFLRRIQITRAREKLFQLALTRYSYAMFVHVNIVLLGRGLDTPNGINENDRARIKTSTKHFPQSAMLNKMTSISFHAEIRRNAVMLQLLQKKYNFSEGRYTVIDETPMHTAALNEESWDIVKRKRRDYMHRLLEKPRYKFIQPDFSRNQAQAFLKNSTVQDDNPVVHLVNKNVAKEKEHNAKFVYHVSHSKHYSQGMLLLRWLDPAELLGVYIRLLNTRQKKRLDGSSPVRGVSGSGGVQVTHTVDSEYSARKAPVATVSDEDSTGLIAVRKTNSPISRSAGISSGPSSQDTGAMGSAGGGWEGQEIRPIFEPVTTRPEKDCSEKDFVVLPPPLDQQVQRVVGVSRHIKERSNDPSRIDRSNDPSCIDRSKVSDRESRRSFSPPDLLSKADLRYSEDGSATPSQRPTGLQGGDIKGLGVGGIVVGAGTGTGKGTEMAISPVIAGKGQVQVPVSLSNSNRAQPQAPSHASRPTRSGGSGMQQHRRTVATTVPTVIP